MAYPNYHQWGRKSSKRGAAMRKIVPQRVIKSRFRLAITLVSLFFLTIIGCIACLYIALSSRLGIISPLAKYVYEVRDTSTEKATVTLLCQKYMIPCQNITVQSDGTIQFLLNNQTTVLLSGQKNLEEQLASLQKVASQLTIKGKTIKQIDFRFNNVTVT